VMETGRRVACMLYMHVLGLAICVPDSITDYDDGDDKKTSSSLPPAACIFLQILT